MTARALADPGEVARRLAALDEPHVRPLNDWVRRLRELRGGGEVVPWVDPAGPGTAAVVLFLLEAPGAMATAVSASGRRRAGSGFISPDNDDRTAAGLSRMRDEAGLSPDVCLHGNVVPWYIGTTSAIRAPRKSDIVEALPHLQEFLELLPDLRVIVPMGRAAQAALAVGGPRLVRGRTVIETLHPSPLVLNRRPENRQTIVEDLRRVRDAAGGARRAPTTARAPADAVPPESP